MQGIDTFKVDQILHRAEALDVHFHAVVQKIIFVLKIPVERGPGDHGDPAEISEGDLLKRHFRQKVQERLHQKQVGPADRNMFFPDR